MKNKRLITVPPLPISFGAVITQEITYRTGTYSVNVPTCEVGDLLCCVYMVGSLVTPVVPSGWTNAFYGGTYNNRVALSYRVVDGTEAASYTFGFNGVSIYQFATMYVLKNVNLDNPFDNYLIESVTGTTGGYSFNTSSFTGNYKGALLFHVGTAGANKGFAATTGLETMYYLNGSYFSTRGQILSPSDLTDYSYTFTNSGFSYPVWFLCSLNLRYK